MPAIAIPRLPLRGLLLTLSSAVLLIVAFPNWNQPWCAWVALVPWLVALRQTSGRRAFGLSYLVGLAFFLGSMWWLTKLTPFGGPMAIVGWLVLCAYLALYFGAFGWMAHQLLGTGDGGQGTGKNATGRRRFSLSLEPCTLNLLLLPSAWVALEYLRSHLLSGFGWNLLGYSQASAPSVLQVADLTGAWGVSFVLVMMNVAVVTALERRPSGRRAAAVIAAGLVMLGTAGYGRYRLAQPVSGSHVTIAVVQGSIPQDEKWDEARKPVIVAQYAQLTLRAAEGHPQVIVWPETAVPGYLELDEPLTAQVRAVVQSVKTPMLVGAPMARAHDGAWETTNSAALFNADGVLVARYDKLRLVPFGEFVPGESWLPWLRDILPPIGNFVPGQELTVFKLQGARSKVQGVDLEPRALSLEPTFSVLICFEDVFPDLARRFVNRGAQMLVTITNDAWFGDTAAAYQHAQASTLRAVELRVPMVRAANTGWSGCIDAKGRWLASVRAADGHELFVPGMASCEVTVGNPASLYRRWGDWFAWLCLLGCLGWAIFAIMKR